MIAALLLAALAGWIVPAKTAAQPIQKFDVRDKQIRLAKESVSYKTDAPSEAVPSPSSTTQQGILAPRHKNGTTRKAANRLVGVTGNNEGQQRSISGYGGRNYSKEEVEALIRSYAHQYGANENLAVRIAYCESGYNQRSANKHSSARGVFQYLGSTWSNTPAGRSGASVYDADANVRTAVQYIATKGTSPWNASRSC